MNYKRILFLLFFIILFIFLGTCNCFALTFIDNTENNTGAHIVPDFPDNLLQYTNDIPYIIRARFDKKTNSYTDYYFFFAVNNSSAFFYHQGDAIYYDNGSGGRRINQINYNVANNKWTTNLNNGLTSTAIHYEASDAILDMVFYATDIYTDKNKTSIWFDYTSVIYPYIMNTKDNLAMLDFDTLMIDSGNVDIEAGYFDFIVSTSNQGSSDSNIVYTTKLDNTSEFYHSGGVNGDYYEIPVSVFKKFLSQGEKVDYILLYKLVGSDTSSTDTISVVYGGVVENSTDNILNSGFNQMANIMNNIIKDNEQKHKESEETQKGILNTIKQVIGFINPLSENFFVYKLIDLLLELLIKVFVPSGEFFSEWFSDLNEYFGDRFGMLYYPFELIIDILNRISTLSSSLNGNFVLKTPNLDIFGSTLIPAYEFNFNEFLQNETFKTVYNIYLTSVDVILVCCLVVLCKNTFVEIFGGRFVDDLADAANSDTRLMRDVRRRTIANDFYRKGYK